MSFSVIKIVKESAQLLYSKGGYLIRASLLSFILYTLVYKYFLIGTLDLSLFSEVGMSFDQFKSIVLYGSLTLCLYSVVAINCHRVLLQGIKSVPKFGIYWFGSRELRFTGWVLVNYYYLLVFALLFGFVVNFIFSMLVGAFIYIAGNKLTVVIPFFDINVILKGIALYFTCVICTRLLLLLPASAIGQNLNIRQVWEITRGYGFKLVLLLVGSPIFAIYLLLWLEQSNSALVQVVLFSINYLLMLIQIVFLSVCYKSLITGLKSEDIEN